VSLKAKMLFLQAFLISIAASLRAQLPRSTFYTQFSHLVIGINIASPANR